MTTTKLHINISQGVIDIEGDPELVREIYNDFKEQLLVGGAASSGRPQAPAQAVNGQQPMDDAPEKVKTKAKQRRPTPRKKGNGSIETGVATTSPKSPKLDKQLDTSGLREFFSKYEPKNASEKILIFLKFLIDVREIESPNTDQIYTCFDFVHERVPNAFAQAFIDTAGKFGYIDYNSPTDIKVTTMGNNHFKHDLKKKKDAE